MRRGLVLARALAVALALVASGCGYRPLRSGLGGHPLVRVERTLVHAPGGEQATIGASAENGARAELSRFGALAEGDGAEVDVLNVEIVRVDERSEGVSVDDLGKPHARGIRLRITARGLVHGHGQSFETVDLDASEVVATSASPLEWDGARTAAARGAARKVGELVAREVLGIP